ncbi:hypothetical protein COV20_00190 [Candidatus Woesearchaeota archaeon CG10_big_fil_rev_8_21_14_0_10_45_16]|nr:MAG: hypothetical protein COV20_00190 [Candidatus Woesearchaeota archaeon CG10_big_fil_rev_8_21_14_0_10_45_16]
MPIENRLRNIHIPDGKGLRGANAFGTALYLAGVIPADVFVTLDETLKHLGRLERIDEARVGDLAVVRPLRRSSAYFPSVQHSGVVVAIDPDYILHRPSFNAPTRTNSLGQLREGYRSGLWDIEFYRLRNESQSK